MNFFLKYLWSGFVGLAAFLWTNITAPKLFNLSFFTVSVMQVMICLLISLYYFPLGKKTVCRGLNRRHEIYVFGSIFGNVVGYLMTMLIIGNVVSMPMIGSHSLAEYL